MPSKRTTSIKPIAVFEEEFEMTLNGIEIFAGDEVKVLQPPGKVTRLKRLSGSFYFAALVTNKKGSQWVDVYEGKTRADSPELSKLRRLRSFEIDRIEPIKPKKTRRKKPLVADSDSSS